MGPVLVVLLAEEATLVDVQLQHVGDLGAVPVDPPGIQVLVAGHIDLLEHPWRDVGHAGDGGPEPVHILLGEAHLHAGFAAPDLLRGAAWKNADEVGAPFSKNVLDGAPEPRAVSQQQHHGRDAPRHPGDGDEGAPPVVDHRFPCLAPDITDHRNLLIRGAEPPPAPWLRPARRDKAPRRCRRRREKQWPAPLTRVASGVDRIPEAPARWRAAATT